MPEDLRELLAITTAERESARRELSRAMDAVDFYRSQLRGIIGRRHLKLEDGETEGHCLEKYIQKLEEKAKRRKKTRHAG